MGRCYKCGHDGSTYNHHIVPQSSSAYDASVSDLTKPLCRTCHRYVTIKQNQIENLSKDEHIQMFKEFVSTGLPAEWDYLLLGSLLVGSNISHLESFYEALGPNEWLDIWHALAEGNFRTWSTTHKAKEAIEKRQKQGYYQGGIPYGLTMDEETKKLKKDPVEWQRCEQIWESGEYDGTTEWRILKRGREYYEELLEQYG